MSKHRRPLHNHWPKEVVYFQRTLGWAYGMFVRSVGSGATRYPRDETVIR
jgi:hypothetical protein